MNNLDTLSKQILKIENKLEKWQDDLALNGKNIQTALVEHASLLAYYDQIAVEANHYVEYMEMVVKKVRAERMRFVRDNFAKEYTDTAIQRVVDGDKEYIKMQELYLEVKELYDRCKSIVEAFKQRSYRLNNLTEIYKNELENITIRM